jgi:hypothetical protein
MSQAVPNGCKDVAIESVQLDYSRCRSSEGTDDLGDGHLAGAHSYLIFVPFGHWSVLDVNELDPAAEAKSYGHSNALIDGAFDGQVVSCECAY